MPKKTAKRAVKKTAKKTVKKTAKRPTKKRAAKPSMSKPAMKSHSSNGRDVTHRGRMKAPVIKAASMTFGNIDSVTLSNVHCQKDMMINTVYVTVTVMVSPGDGIVDTVNAKLRMSSDRKSWVDVPNAVGLLLSPIGVNTYQGTLNCKKSDLGSATFIDAYVDVGFRCTTHDNADASTDVPSCPP